MLCLSPMPLNRRPKVPNLPDPHRARPPAKRVRSRPKSDTAAGNPSVRNGSIPFILGAGAKRPILSAGIVRPAIEPTPSSRAKRSRGSVGRGGGPWIAASLLATTVPSKRVIP